MEGMEEKHPEKREEKHQSSSNLGRLQGNMTLRTSKIRQMLQSFFCSLSLFSLSLFFQWEEVYSGEKWYVDNNKAGLKLRRPGPHQIFIFQS